MECFEGPYRMGRMIALAGKSATKKHWICGDDYGRQVARAFKIVPATESREYVVQGAETYTDTEATDIFIKNYTKKKLFKIDIPEVILKFNGLFSKKWITDITLSMH